MASGLCRHRERRGCERSKTLCALHTRNRGLTRSCLPAWASIVRVTYDTRASLC